MDYKPFTYEHFIQSFQLLKDDMLMYYIDEAVAIYCKLKGKAVGPRPANRKDYSLEYEDAFEAANCAIYIAATKMGAYKPEKGQFRPYLRRAIESALRDIFRADGYGIITSGNIENEPDTSDSDLEERIRRHKDDALETIIRFIDTLPEINRAAVYASAFGQALRPDLESYGRNYAEIVAKQYQTTAPYIRKLASEGKAAALKEAERLGFSERSIGTISIGMMLAKVKTPPDPYDAVIQAVDKLDPYQQFMLLRHLANTQK